MNSGNYGGDKVTIGDSPTPPRNDDDDDDTRILRVQTREEEDTAAPGTRGNPNDSPDARTHAPENLFQTRTIFLNRRSDDGIFTGRYSSRVRWILLLTVS